MSKRVRQKLRGLVPHPRYGAEVRNVGDIEGAKLAQLYYEGWCRRDEMFWESAIRADLSRQKYFVMPRAWYVDTLKTCRDCGRRFLFFAEEQRHWYETLRFNINADCVRCCECRKTERAVWRRFQRYSRLVAKTDLNGADLASLVGDACFLWEEGMLKDHEKLRRLKNLSRRRLAGKQAVMKIERICDRIADEETAAKSHA